jgi:RNA polymerase sigma-70 factor (sigma-E family)
METEFEEEFADFVVRWSPALLRFAFLLTCDRGDAEDLLQTALLKTWHRWNHLADRDAAYAYVRRVVVTTHISWRRRRRVPEVLLHQIPEPPTSTPGAIEIGGALRALGQLPPRMRAVVVLRCYEGVAEAEAAAALGCSVGSVKSQTSRGLARLRELLDLPSTTTASEATR